MSERMNPDVKAKWLAALRSGEYKQGSGTLHSAIGEFCCLGVLCDLAVKSGLGIEVVSTEFMDTLYDGTGGFLPQSVVTWAGLASRDPEAGERGKLSTRNDEGTPFAEIAALIEEEL